MAIGWCGWQAFCTTPTTHGIPVQIAVVPIARLSGCRRHKRKRTGRASNGYAIPIAELSGPPHGDPAAGNGSVAPAMARWQRLRLELILARSQATWQSKEDELLDRTVAQRMIEPGGDLEQLVEPLMAGRRSTNGCCWPGSTRSWAARNWPPSRCWAASAARRRCRGWCTSSLKPAVHLPAIRAPLAIADAGTLAWLAHDEPDPGLQEEILCRVAVAGRPTIAVLCITQQGARPCFDCGLDWRQQWTCAEHGLCSGLGQEGRRTGQTGGATDAANTLQYDACRHPSAPRPQCAFGSSATRRPRRLPRHRRR